LFLASFTERVVGLLDEQLARDQALAAADATIADMAETPDFDAIALQFSERHGIERLNEWDPSNEREILADLAEQLRLVWNARGGVDIAKIGEELRMMMGASAAGPYVSNLDRALRRLDR